MGNVKYENPKILAVDIDDKDVIKLKNSGFNVDEGTFGYSFRCNQYDEVNFNGKLPFITEKDIVVVNMLNDRTIKVWKDYKDNYPSSDRMSVYVPSGQKYFDPTCIYSRSCKKDLIKVLNNAGVVIVFASTKYVESYYYAQYKENSAKRYEDEEISNYDWIPVKININNCRVGKNICAESKVPKLKSLGEMLLKDNEVLYQCNFGLASYIEGNILSNNLGESVGYIDYIKTDDDKFGWIILLPQFKDKAKVIEILFKELIVRFRPDLFPQYVQNNWLNDEEYILPEVKKISEEKKRLEEEYNEKLNEIEKKKKEIEDKNKFLTNILIAEGYDKFLVDNVKAVLEFIGYRQVIDVDSQIEGGNRQEDLQILDSDRFDIVEVKGHKGNPTEDDCQAVLKYINRQMREKNRHDIHGILIVNHNRIIPPLERSKPAFTEAQIKDAERDNYTLVSTWELYKSARLLQQEIITFEDIDIGLHTSGLYKAIPTNWYSIGKIKHLFKEGTIACFYLAVDKISNGDKIVIQDNNDFFMQEIEEMQIDNNTVEEAVKGDELSIKINKSISKNATVYLIVK